MQRNRLQERFATGQQAQTIANILTLLGSILALLTTSLAWAQAFMERNWGQFGIYSVFCVFLIALGATLLKARAGVPPDTTVFQPFVDIEELVPWPRPEEAGRLREAIDGKQNTVVLVVGASGVGKTVLLRRLLRDSGSNPSELLYFDSYELIESDLEDALWVHHEARTPHSVTVILDQFEQFIAASEELSSRNGMSRRAWLNQLIRKTAQKNGVRFIISIRREWYYELRFLGDLIPSPSDCLHVGAPSALTSPEHNATGRAVTSRLRQVLQDTRLVDRLLSDLDRGRGMLPLEVQLVGAVVERARLRGERLDEHYWTNTICGVEGAIEKFFDEIISGAPDRRIALKLLCALSVRTRFRRREDLSDIVERLYEERASVVAVKDYLCAHGLVLERTPARLELAHDYLAEFFHHKSGSELNPVDRDNIFFHLESNQTPAQTGMVMPASVKMMSGRYTFGLLVIVPLLVSMIVRLLGFGLQWNVPWSGVESRYLFGDFLDVMYLPIFVAHVGWAVYVYLFYERVFSHLDEGLVGRLFSRFVVLNMAACVVACYFMPDLWILLLGWGGVVVGLKLIILARRAELNVVAATRIGEAGTKTAINLLFLLGGGIYAAFLTIGEIDTKNAQNSWLLVNLVVSMAFTWACYALSVIHVSREAASRTLGLIARSNSGVGTLRGL